MTRDRTNFSSVNSNISFFILVCGGNYFTSSGTIVSPGWPSGYPAKKDCIWTIRAGIGQQIMLNFKEIRIVAETNEDGRKCLFDFLEIRNGVNSDAPLIGRFCGSVLPKDISSFANNIYLHFRSLKSSVGGFHLTWDSTATGMIYYVLFFQLKSLDRFMSMIKIDDR